MRGSNVWYGSNGNHSGGMLVHMAGQARKAVTIHDHSHPIWDWLRTATLCLAAFGIVWCVADTFDDEWKSVLGIVGLFVGDRLYQQRLDHKKDEQ